MKCGSYKRFVLERSQGCNSVDGSTFPIFQRRIGIYTKDHFTLRSLPWDRPEMYRHVTYDRMNIGQYWTQRYKVSLDLGFQTRDGHTPRGARYHF